MRLRIQAEVVAMVDDGTVDSIKGLRIEIKTGPLIERYWVKVTPTAPAMIERLSACLANGDVLVVPPAWSGTSTTPLAPRTQEAPDRGAPGKEVILCVARPGGEEWND